MKRSLLFLLSLFSITCLYAQNAIIGSGFTSGWGGACTNNTQFEYFSPGAGSSFISIQTPTGTGNRFFRLAIDWSGTVAQNTITPGSDFSVLPNTVYTLNNQCTSMGSMVINVPNAAFNYVFKTRNAGINPSRNFVFFEVQGDIRSVTSVTQDIANPISSQNVTVTANLNGALSAGQTVWLRYTTTNDFSTSTVIQMSVMGTTATATIPAQTSGTTVRYNVLTSGTPSSISHEDADLFTINLNNNNGSNYSYVVQNLTGAAKTIDGNYSDWTNSEIIASVVSEPVFVSWDNDNFYFRFLNGFGNSDRINIGFDVNPGTLYSSVTGAFSRAEFTGYHTPEYVIQSTGTTSLNLFTRNGNQWSAPTDIYGSGTNLWRSGINAELRVSRSVLGLTSPSIPFTVFIWYSNSADNIYRAYGAGNFVDIASSVSQLVRTGFAFSGSQNGVNVSEVVAQDINSSESNYYIPAGINFRNLYVSSGTAITPAQSTTFAGDIIINASSTLTLNTTDGDISVGGNWNNGGSLISNDRRITFTGSGTKTIQTGGSGTGKSFSNLTFNGSGATWQLSGNSMAVNGNLTFTNGKLDLNGNNLLLGSTASVNGASSSSYVITSNGTNSGFVTRTIASGETFSYPVGTSSNYMPVTLKDEASSSHSFSVKAYAPPTKDGVPGSSSVFNQNELNRMVAGMWNIDRTSGSGDVLVTLNWQDAQEGASFAGLSGGQIGISRRDDVNGWAAAVQSGLANNTTNTVSAIFSSFSPFGVGQLNQVLPVTFTDFRATRNAGAVQLRWEAAETDNLSHYEAERSANGLQFVQVGRVAPRTGSLTAVHQLADERPLAGANFYRIVAVGKNGDRRYSQVLRVMAEASGAGFSVWPHAAGGQMALRMSQLPAGPYSLQVLNSAGQQVYSRNVAHDGGEQYLSLPVPLKAGSGIHYVLLRGKIGVYRQATIW